MKLLRKHHGSSLTNGFVQIYSWTLINTTTSKKSNCYTQRLHVHYNEETIQLLDNSNNTTEPIPPNQLLTSVISIFFNLFRYIMARIQNIRVEHHHHYDNFR